MKTQIHRFKLTLKPDAGLTKLSLPEGAVVVKAAVSVSSVMAGEPAVNIWALGDTEAKQAPRYFQAFQTGESLPEWVYDARYLTVEGLQGIHLFEVEAAHLKEKKGA